MRSSKPNIGGFLKRIKGFVHAHKRLTGLVFIIVLVCAIAVIAYVITRKSQDDDSSKRSDTCTIIDAKTVESIKNNQADYSKAVKSSYSSNLCAGEDVSGYNKLSADQKKDQFTASSSLAKEAYKSGDKTKASAYAKSALAAGSTLDYSDRQSLKTSEIFKMNDIAQGR